MLKISGFLFILVMSGFILMAADLWNQQNGSSYRTGRSELKGDLDGPGVLWKFFLGGSLLQTETFFDKDTGSIYIISAGRVNKFDINGELIWSSEMFDPQKIWGLYDLNNDGTDELIVSKTGLLHIIHVDSGLPISTLEMPYNLLKISDLDGDGFPEILTREAWMTAGLKAYDFTNGLNSADLKWTYSEYVPVNGFELVAGDIYSVPGRKDIIIDRTDGGSILTINGASGEVINYRNKRIFFGNSSYGHAELADIDSDGKNEFIFSGMSAAVNDGRTVQITVYDPIDTAVKWYYEFGRKTTEKKLDMPYDAVGDLDGDGTIEIAVNVYNNTLELANSAGAETHLDLDGINEPDKWVAVIYDAAGGTVRSYIPDGYIEGSADMDGDGKKELIVRKTKSGTKTMPAFSSLSIYSYDKGIIAKIDETERVYVIKRPVDMMDSRGDSYTSQLIVNEDLTGTGRPSILVVKDINFDNFADTMIILSLQDGQMVFSHESELSDGRVLAFSFFKDGYLGMIGNDGLFYIFQIRPEGMNLLKEIPVGGHIGNAILINTEKGGAVLTSDSARNMYLLNAAGASEDIPPEINWSGRNTMNQPFFAFDSNGDGYDEFLQMDMSPDMQPRLFLKDGSGSNIWVEILSYVNLLPKAFIAGRFKNSVSEDLAYMTEYSSAGSCVETRDGVNGDFFVLHGTSDAGTYSNQNLLLAGDVNSDGFDDIFAIHPAKVELLSGKDLSRITIWNAPNWNLNGVSADFDGDGVNEVFTNSRENAKSVFNNDGSPLWSISFDQSSSYYLYDSPYPGISRIDAAEGFDVAVSGMSGDISAYSGADGSVLWRVCLNDGAVSIISTEDIPSPSSCGGTALSNIVTGDIDGDLSEEFITGDRIGNLYVLDSKNGALEWTMKFNAAVGNPVLGDTNGDSNAEIIVGVGDGYLYSIGRKEEIIEEEPDDPEDEDADSPAINDTEEDHDNSEEDDISDGTEDEMPDPDDDETIDDPVSDDAADPENADEDEDDVLDHDGADRPDESAADELYEDADTAADQEVVDNDDESEIRSKNSGCGCSVL